MREDHYRQACDMIYWTFYMTWRHNKYISWKILGKADEISNF